MHHQPQSSSTSRTPWQLAGSLILFAALPLSSCSRSEIVAPQVQSVGEVAVDASAAWAYVSLAKGATVAEVEAQSSADWDIAFNATSVELNGGSSGPAGVTGFCVCQNAAATDAQVLQMTPDNQDSTFDVVTSADVPASSSVWSSDVFAASPWYLYNLTGDHHISPTFEVYFVKRGNAVYKIQLIDYYGPTGATRQISFRYSKVLG